MYLFNFQMPFSPPYKIAPPSDQFPLITKRYPRLTLDINLTFKIGEKTSFISNLSCQCDKGNLPAYPPEFIYSSLEGLKIDIWFISRVGPEYFQGTSLYFRSTSEYLRGTSLYLRGTSEYLQGTSLYLRGTSLYL